MPQRRAILEERRRAAQANLDADEALFLGVDAGGPSAWRLYVNPPSLILGRHQRIEREVNLREAEDRDVPVLRRFTGGGTVYHDAGNLNFAVGEPRPNRGGLSWCLDYGRYAGWLLDVLAELGLEGRLEGNRVDVGGRKISGLAARVGRRAVFVHGTLLVSTDLEGLRALLRVPAAQLRALPAPRGPHVESRPRPETNLVLASGCAQDGEDLRRRCAAAMGRLFGPAAGEGGRTPSRR